MYLFGWRFFLLSFLQRFIPLDDDVVDYFFVVVGVCVLPCIQCFFFFISQRFGFVRRLFFGIKTFKRSLLKSVWTREWIYIFLFVCLYRIVCVSVSDTRVLSSLFNLYVCVWAARERERKKRVITPTSLFMFARSQDTTESNVWWIQIRKR